MNALCYVSWHTRTYPQNGMTWRFLDQVAFSGADGGMVAYEFLSCGTPLYARETFREIGLPDDPKTDQEYWLAEGLPDLPSGTRRSEAPTEFSLPGLVVRLLRADEICGAAWCDTCKFWQAPWDGISCDHIRCQKCRGVVSNCGVDECDCGAEAEAEA